MGSAAYRLGPAASGRLAEPPREIADVLEGLNSWSKAWAAAERNGPYLSLTSTVSLANAPDLVLATLGANNADALFAGGIGPGLVNPPTYPPGSCPSFCAAASPNAAAGGGATAATAAVNAGTLAEPQQERAAALVAAGLDKGRAPSSPTVATLLLAPLFGSIPVGNGHSR